MRQVHRRAVVAKWAVLLVCFFMPAIAEGVTAERGAKKADMDRVDAVTTSAATRALADVQIRRIRGLIGSTTTDSDAAYDRLEKLQKQLRGEK